MKGDLVENFHRESWSQVIHECELLSVTGLLTCFQSQKAVTLVAGQGIGFILGFGVLVFFLKAGREVFLDAQSVELI